MTARARLGASTAISLLLPLLLGACQTDVGTAGCQLTLEVPLVKSPLLTLLPDARLDPVGGGFFLIGSDGTAIRWASLTADGALGPDQMLAVPAGALATVFAFAQTATPADTVVIAVVMPAANGTDAELHFIAAPADGSTPPAPGPSVLTFPGGATTPPTLAMATTRQGVTADLAWIDAPTSTVMLANVDGMGQLGGPLTIDSAPAFKCLGFSPASNGDLAVSFLRYDTAGGVPTWEKVERTASGGTMGLKLMVASGSAGSTMTCAIGLPLPTGYSLAWQDDSGSWLSIDTMMTGGVVGGNVMSYPFASANDFGGPNLQPPIVGLAPFATDYGVLFSGAHAVELWRLDANGNRSPGKLVFPSQEGNLGKVSAAWTGGTLAATYADYSTGTAPSQRWFVNAACY